MKPDTLKLLVLSLIVTAVMCLAACLGGCNGVQVNATYSALLDQTAALSKETAARAQAGTLTEDQKTQALVGQAATWQMFRDARDGKASDSPPPSAPVPSTQAGN